MIVTRLKRITGRLVYVRLAVMDDSHFRSVIRMRADWRHGITLEPSEPPWAKGSGKQLVWED